MRRIRITTGKVEAIAQLAQSSTAEAVWNALPLRAAGSRWGKEIYFSIPVRVQGDSMAEIVQKGDLGYWEPGHAFCIFWGPTPASHGDEIRPASPVAVFGRVEGDASVFDTVPSGAPVLVERLAEQQGQ